MSSTAARPAFRRAERPAPRDHATPPWVAVILAADIMIPYLFAAAMLEFHGSFHLKPSHQFWIGFMSLQYAVVCGLAVAKPTLSVRAVAGVQTLLTALFAGGPALLVLMVEAMGGRPLNAFALAGIVVAFLNLLAFAWMWSTMPPHRGEGLAVISNAYKVFLVLKVVLWFVGLALTMNG